MAPPTLFLLLSLLSCASIAAPTKYFVHEKRHEAIEFNGTRMDANAVIPLRIALLQTNLHNGYDRLMEVSDPKSSGYGRHWTAEEVHNYFAPADESIQVVKDWLLASGVPNGNILHYENKGWLAVDLRVAEVEALLSAEYYEHDIDGETRIGCDSYSLPEHVSTHVDFVKPGVAFSAPVSKRTLLKRDVRAPSMKREASLVLSRPMNENINHKLPPAAAGLPPELQACDTNITPPCIKALYGIPEARYNQPENVLGIYARGDKFSQADLDLFFENYAPQIPEGTTPEVISIDGGTAPVSAKSVLNFGESDVDLDLAYSLVYPQEVTVYQVDDDPSALLRYKGASPLFNTFLDAIDGSYCNYSAYGESRYPPTSRWALVLISYRRHDW